MSSSRAATATATAMPSWWLYLAPLYIGYRMALANRMPIMDCDEVFNYWEPLHYLEYGEGLQTWEYAPDYALRTYAYLLPLQYASRLLTATGLVPLLAPMLTNHAISSDKLALFVVLRSMLAGLTACCELLFLTALSEPVPFGTSLTRQTLLPEAYTSYVSALVMLTSTGMTHASGALLPSSSVMMLWLVAASAYIRHAFRLYCAVAVVATLCLGWPFGVVVFVPMGVDLLLRHHPAPIRLLLEVAVWTAFVQGTVMYIDFPHYGKWTSPTLNIFEYNAQSGGDELYGIEPTSYYAKNLALNFNYVAFFGLLLLPVSALLRSAGAAKLPTSLIVVLAGPIYLWLTIVVPRPHKEERFLFPIYPALTVAAVVVVQQLWLVVCRVLIPAKSQKRVQHLWTLAFLPACLLSVSRSAALSKYYTAPLQVYAALPVAVPQQQRQTQIVCTCGEWYRFPSSYYLPDGYNLGFLPSSFKGQLPKAFEANLGSRGGTNFNDENKEEMDRYVAVEDCDYIVELESSADAECLQVMMKEEDQWTKLADEPYLDASQTSSLHRILYLPFLHKAKYLSYSLYAKQQSKSGL